ncbi:MAG: hypothetical protein WD691_10705 [Acidimicrobiales bacterium]
MPGPVRRAIWVCEPTGPALVLGSAQRDDVVDVAACQRSGVEVVRRRSGGGAVLVEPASPLWVDVLIPATDPLWEPDVGQAFLWLGEAWALALGDLGVATEVHRGPPIRTGWSDRVCFAGLGPGELTDRAGRKVLGISQRRTRSGARFQCAIPTTWDPAVLLGLLALSDDERAAALSDLADAAVGPAVAPTHLLSAFLARLPEV